MAARSTVPNVRPLGDHRHTPTCIATPGDLVRRYGVSERTVRRWANEGKVWSCRPADHRRYCWYQLGEQS